MVTYANLRVIAFQATGAVRLNSIFRCGGCFCFNSMSTAINMHGYLVKLIAWERNGSVFDKPIGNVNYKTEFEIFSEERCRCIKFQN